MPESWGLAVALVTTLALMGPVTRGLRRHRVLDLPTARSSHSEVTPRGGGVAVMLGLLAGALVVGGPDGLWALLALALLGAALGLTDDLRGLSALLRLAVQLLLSLAASLLLLQESDEMVLGAFAFVVTAVIWLAGYMNAFNFMDGINGISGTSGALAGGWFWLLGSTNDDVVLSVGGALLVGACLAFLPWNVPRAKVFLGDVGSYGLGLLIGSLAAWAATHGVAPGTAAAPLLLYVADTSWTLVLRLCRGDSWRQAHRQHVYQRLCDLGLGHVQVTVVVLVVSCAACAAYWWLPGPVAPAVTATLLGLYLASPRVLSTLVKHGGQRAVR